jgi:undecaprenyl-diphosphatase
MVLAAAAMAGYVVLTVLVATGVTEPLDAAARSFFRPDDVWGPTQIRADVVVEGFKPRNLALLVPVVGLFASIRRSSWRPLWYAAAIACVAGVLTFLTKLLLARPDTHRMVLDYGGSYPSGHTVTVLVSLGVTVLVLERRSHWWEWGLVAMACSVMGLALLVQAAHWFSDVVGGLLLGVAVLGAASGWHLRQPPRHHPG